MWRSERSRDTRWPFVAGTRQVVQKEATLPGKHTFAV
jgi:hypothetical protein